MFTNCCKTKMPGGCASWEKVLGVGGRGLGTGVREGRAQQHLAGRCGTDFSNADTDKAEEKEIQSERGTVKGFMPSRSS